MEMKFGQTDVFMHEIDIEGYKTFFSTIRLLPEMDGRQVVVGITVDDNIQLQPLPSLIQIRPVRTVPRE